MSLLSEYILSDYPIVRLDRGIHHSLELTFFLLNLIWTILAPNRDEASQIIVFILVVYDRDVVKVKYILDDYSSYSCHGVVDHTFW
jgi:hypothetical protein